MKLGIIRLFVGDVGKVGYYNVQEVGLAKALEKKRISTDIFFFSKESDYREEVISKYIRILHIPCKYIGNHSLVSPKFILKYKLDVVHLLSDNQIMVRRYINYCNKNNIPVYCYIGEIYSHTSNKYKRIIMDLIGIINVKSYKKTVNLVKNTYIRDMLIQRDIQNVTVMPVGLDITLIPSNIESKSNLRKKYHIPDEKKVLIFIGRLEVNKNPLLALKILKEINKDSEDFYMIMIGSGALNNILVNYVKENDMGKYIKFITKAENFTIHDYLKCSDIFINLCENEIFGMALLEAMYNKCAVVAFDAPGPKDIITNNKDGILLDNLDINNWVSKIKFIDKDYGSLAKIKVEECFNWDIISDKYIKLFQQLRVM